MFSSVQSLSRVRLFATPWIAARQASLSITNSWSSVRLASIESVMPSSHLILCHPLLLLPPIPPRISLFQWVNSSHEMAKVLEFQPQPSFPPKKSQGWSPSVWFQCVCPLMSSCNTYHLPWVSLTLDISYRTLYILLWAGIPEKKWSGHHGQQKSLKCSTRMHSQKRQNDLCLFPRQTIQYHSNPSLCPNQ